MSFPLCMTKWPTLDVCVDMIGFVLSLMLHYISYDFHIVLTELTRVLKIVPCVCRAFLFAKFRRQCPPSSLRRQSRVCKVEC